MRDNVHHCMNRTYFELPNRLSLRGDGVDKGVRDEDDDDDEDDEDENEEAWKSVYACVGVRVLCCIVCCVYMSCRCLRVV
jgi:hypothetical protein